MDVEVLGMDWRSYLVFLQIFSSCGPRRVSAMFWPSSVHSLIVSSLRGCMTLTFCFSHWIPCIVTKKKKRIPSKVERRLARSPFGMMEGMSSGEEGFFLF